MPAAPTGPWETDYRYSERFEEDAFGRELLDYNNRDAIDPKSSTTPYRLDGVTDTCHPLLTKDGEWMLFMKMNYAKHLACQAPEKSIRRQKFILIAQETRNFIVLHNQRLVTNLAKKQVSPVEPLQAVVSDGNMSLLKAVDKFDPNRRNAQGGVNKFSTYATWAINKNFWGAYRNRCRDIPMSDTSIDSMPVPDPKSVEDCATPISDLLYTTLKAVDDLSPRARDIVLHYYGIRGEPLNYKELGRRFKLSKARVGQIITRARVELKKALRVPLYADEMFMDWETRQIRKRHEEKKRQARMRQAKRAAVA